MNGSLCLLCAYIFHVTQNTIVGKVLLGAAAVKLFRGLYVLLLKVFQVYLEFVVGIGAETH